MPDHTRRAHAHLLARARAALEERDRLGEQARHQLIDDLHHAEDLVHTHVVPWPVDIHVAHVDHREGGNLYAALTREALMAKVGAYCREWWSEITDNLDPPPLQDEDVAKIYFDNHADEYLSAGHISITGPEEASRSALRIRLYLTISSNHIKPSTADLLDQWAPLLPEHRPIGVAVTGHGWFVLTDPLDEDALELIPADLIFAITFARNAGCRYLLLDSDGGHVEALELFDR